MNKNRKTFLVASAIVTALAAAIIIVVTRNEEPPALQPVIPVDGWAPYWALEDSAKEISQRAGSMREVSPFWYRAAGTDRIEIDPNASEKLIKKFLKKTRDAKIVPSIVDALPAGEMAAILADPTTRRRHVDAILAFAQEGDFDGIDLNYEQFAFADGRDSWETNRPNWVSFVTDLAAALHGDGRTLTVTIPVVYDADRTPESGYWVYDYGAIVEHADLIRIMAYDYSVRDPGSIAPLDFVQRAINGAIAATGRPDKLVLGIPAYGRNWTVSTDGVCPLEDEENGITVPGTTSVTARSVNDLIERRNATPVYDPSTAEWSFEYELEISDSSTTCVQTRRVHYVDAEGVRARMEMAIEAGFSGVALWALGFDDDAIWDAILIDATLPESDSAD